MMFHRIQQYELIYRGGRWYRPRAYGDDRQPDGTWDGWLIFFPIDGSSAIAAPGPETTQSTWTMLVIWAADLTLAYLEGALARALRLAQQPLLIDHLADAEYEALEDVEQLERSAEVERTAADLDEAGNDVAAQQLTPAPPRPRPQMRASKLAHQGAAGLAHGGSHEVELHCLDRTPNNGRFCGVHEWPVFSCPPRFLHEIHLAP